MRETVAAFEARTRTRYDPSPWLRGVGRYLAEDEPCPTLFRYPGPCGLKERFDDRLIWLAKQDQDAVWLADRPWHADATGAAVFGALGILEPMRLHPCAAPDWSAPLVEGEGAASVFVAANRPIPDPDLLVWIPPSKVRLELPFDEVATPGQAIALFGAGYAEERARVGESLDAYLEELSALERSGAPGPNVPWHEVAPEERRRRIAEAGVVARWTG